MQKTTPRATTRVQMATASWLPTGWDLVRPVADVGCLNEHESQDVGS